MCAVTLRRAARRCRLGSSGAARRVHGRGPVTVSALVSAALLLSASASRSRQSRAAHAPPAAGLEGPPRARQLSIYGPERVCARLAPPDPHPSPRCTGWTLTRVNIPAYSLGPEREREGL